MKFGTTNGAVGELEWIYDEAESSRGLILCHPHPLYGGSMLDGVLETTCRAATRFAIATVRFNFRGVGASAGSFDQGVGEVEDLARIVDAFQANFNELWIGGYSFGAHIALQYATANAEVSNLLLIAPPTQDALPEIAATAHVIVGDNDPISALDSLAPWVNESASRFLYPIEEADHFLVAAGYELESTLAHILDAS